MALVSRTEFAEICGVSTGYVNMYVKRKKITVLPTGQIDTENPLNIAFKRNLIANRNKGVREKRIIEKKKVEIKESIEKQIAEQYKDIVQTVEVFTPKETPKQRKQREKQNESDAEALSWDLRKKIADTLKAERSAEKEQLAVEKLMGNLMPVDMVEQITRVNTQDIFKSFENELVNLGSIYCDILAGGDRDKLAELIKKIRQKLEFVIQKTEKSSLQEIENVIQDYAEVRSRGEKK